MKKIEKRKIYIIPDDIDKIAKYIQEKDKNKIYNLCYKMGLTEISKEFDEDYVYYSIMESIENDTILMEFFKKKSLQNESLHQLFKYLKKTENIRYFVDNKEKYNLSNDDIEIMYDYFNKRYIEKIKQKNIVKEWPRYKYVIYILVILIFIILSLIPIRPYYLIEIKKDYVITEAVVTEVKREENFLGSYDRRITYEYIVDGVKYYKENVLITDVPEDTTSIGPRLIYYNKKTPDKSEEITMEYINTNKQYRFYKEHTIMRILIICEFDFL